MHNGKQSQRCLAALRATVAMLPEQFQYDAQRAVTTLDTSDIKTAWPSQALARIGLLCQPIGHAWLESHIAERMRAIITNNGRLRYIRGI